MISLQELRTADSRFQETRGKRRGAIHAPYTDMNGIEKRTVYVIRSEVDPSRHYTGITNDVPTRLKWHNTGRCGHTSADRPWSLVVTLQFPTEHNAVRFEKYLKTGSGRAFAKRHLAGI